jgi:hypothetical protein
MGHIKQAVARSMALASAAAAAGAQEEEKEQEGRGICKRDIFDDEMAAEEEQEKKVERGRKRSRKGAGAKV